MSDQIELDDAAVEEEDASAKSRMAWLLHNTRAWLIVLVLLIVAGVVVAVSYAAFTSTSANAGNVVAAGSLIIDDDIDNGAILVTISNVGESAGDFTLGQTDVVDTPGANGGNLSSVLELVVTMDGATVYDGLFSALSNVDLGEWQGGESHSFEFIVTLPSAADDTVQGSQVTTTYVWDAVAG
jgi:hypothetical protein